MVNEHVGDRGEERQPVLIERHHGHHHEEVEVHLDDAARHVHQHGRRREQAHARATVRRRRGKDERTKRQRRRRGRSALGERVQNREAPGQREDGMARACAHRIKRIQRCRPIHTSSGRLWPRGRKRNTRAPRPVRSMTRPLTDAHSAALPRCRQRYLVAVVDPALWRRELPEARAGAVDDRGDLVLAEPVPKAGNPNAAVGHERR